MPSWKLFVVASTFVALVFGWPSDFEEFPAASVQLPIDVETVHERVVGDSWWDRRTYVAHIATSHRPLREFNVLPPAGGCGNTSTPFESAAAAGIRCRVATNGGFFDPNAAPHSCFGVAWNRRRPLFRGNVTRVAVFGTRRKAKIDSFITGYLNNTDIDRLHPDSLISGQGWLVRNGKSFLDEALKVEDFTLQRSGSGHYFAGLKAPRLAIGHDIDGKLLLVAIDGDEKFGEGVDLWEFASILLRFGVWNAINLDGGGSVSFAVNGIVANVPSDACESTNERRVNCVRSVATAVCLAPNLDKPSLSLSSSKSIDSSASSSFPLTTTRPTSVTPSLTPQVLSSYRWRGWVFTAICLAAVASLAILHHRGGPCKSYRAV
jgi:hypothetical protein